MERPAAPNSRDNAQEYRNAMTAKGSQAADDILKIALDSRPKIPESVFKQYFLPVLTNTAGTVNLNYWLDYGVKNPNVEAVIVDDVSGAELFVVPSIFSDTGLFDMKTTKHVSFLDVINEGKMILQNHYTVGQDFLVRHIHNGVVATDPNSNYSKWLTIYKRYSIAGMTPDSNTATITEPSTNNLNEIQNAFSGEYED
jgi:hypothetical protein